MKKQISIRQQEARAAFLFLAPFLIGLTIFSIIPIFYSFYISFVDFNTLSTAAINNFVGLRNYMNVFRNPELVGSYFKSLEYAVFYVPLITGGGLLLASAINQKLWLRTIARTMILMPYVSNVVAIGIIFSFIFNPYDGPINFVLKLVGTAGQPMWLAGPETVIPTIAMIAAWQNVAFQMVVFLAALQEVPGEIYESANIDGANSWQKFIKVTLPSISPTTFFLIVTGIIGSTQNFSIVWALTRGGPGDSSHVAAVSIYRTAFYDNRYSDASAQAIILFIFLLVVTIIQWKGQKKWVNY